MSYARGLIKVDIGQSIIARKYLNIELYSSHLITYKYIAHKEYMIISCLLNFMIFFLLNDKIFNNAGESAPMV
jgi:hypothetical protein